MAVKASATYLLPISLRWWQGLPKVLARSPLHVHYLLAQPAPVCPAGSRVVWLLVGSRSLGGAACLGTSEVTQHRRGSANALLRDWHAQSPAGRRLVQATAGSADAPLSALICTNFQAFATPIPLAQLKTLGLKPPVGRHALRRPLRLGDGQFEALLQSLKAD